MRRIAKEQSKKKKKKGASLQDLETQPHFSKQSESPDRYRRQNKRRKVFNDTTNFHSNLKNLEQHPSSAKTQQTINTKITLEQTTKTMLKPNYDKTKMQVDRSKETNKISSKINTTEWNKINTFDLFVATPEHSNTSTENQEIKICFSPDKSPPQNLFHAPFLFLFAEDFPTPQITPQDAQYVHPPPSEQQQKCCKVLNDVTNLTSVKTKPTKQNITRYSSIQNTVAGNSIKIQQTIPAPLDNKKPPDSQPENCKPTQQIEKYTTKANSKNQQLSVSIPPNSTTTEDPTSTPYQTQTKSIFARIHTKFTLLLLPNT